MRSHPTAVPQVTSIVGSAGVAMGFLALALGVATLGYGLRHRQAPLLRLGRQHAWMVLLGALAAAGAMEWALLGNDTG
jgi:hypothetical protein